MTDRRLVFHERSKRAAAARWARVPTKAAIARELNALALVCSCGCGKSLRFRSDRLRRTMFRAGHLPGRWRGPTPEVRSALARARWVRGVYEGQRVREGIRAELLRQFPAHREWIAALRDEDLAGLLSRSQE